MLLSQTIEFNGAIWRNDDLAKQGTYCYKRDMRADDQRVNDSNNIFVSDSPDSLKFHTYIWNYKLSS